MNHASSVKIVSLILSLVPLTTYADQPLLDFNASFTTSDQSIWSSGDAFNESFTQFIGPDISIPTSVIGSGSGDTINVSVPVPVIADPTWSINPYFQYRGNFKAGLEFGAEINGGTINANLDYSFGLSAPDVIQVGEKFSLTPTIQRFNTSSFQTKAANASAYVDAIIESRLQTYARIEVDRPTGADLDYRLGNQGFTSGSTTNRPWYTIPGTNINERKELLSINRNESGRLRYIDPISNPFDDDPGYSSLGTGDTLSTGPLSFTAGNWNTNAAGANNGSSVTGSAQETLVTATLDVDQLVLGSSILGKSIENDWGLLDYDLGYDILDYKANLDVGLKQSFDVNDDVRVRINFSENVLLNDLIETDLYEGLFSDIPDITLLTNMVDADLTFLLDATLKNKTDFTFDGSLDFTFLEAHLNIGYDLGITVPNPFGPDPFYGKSGTAIDEQLGPFYENSQPFDLGDINLFNEEFDLLGFNEVSGGRFTLSAVPVPPAVWLFASAFSSMFYFRKRKIA